MPEYKYWAAISYSHKDFQAAIRLQRRLESYKPPKDLTGHAIPPRPSSVFLDSTDLRASADIGESIREALKSSQFLIVICSPDSAHSRWVNSEVAYFGEELGRKDRILCLLIAGEPETSYCPALLPRTGQDPLVPTDRVPLAADARSSSQERKDAVLKIAAGLLKVDYDELRQRDRLRRRVSIRRWAGASVFLGACILSILWWFKDSGEERTRAAEMARYWDAGRREMVDGKPLRALPFLSHIYSTGEDHAPLRFLLSRAMDAIDAHGLTIQKEDDSIYQSIMSENGALAAAFYDSGDVEVWNLHEERLTMTTTIEDTINAADFSPSQPEIAVAHGVVVEVWNLPANRIKTTLRGHGLDIKNVRYSADGSRIATASVDDTARLWDSGTGRQLCTFLGHTGTVLTVDFSSDGARLATSSFDGTIRVWDTAACSQMTSLEMEPGDIRVVLFDSGSEQILAATWSGLQAWKLQEPRREEALGAGGFVFAAYFEPISKKPKGVASDNTNILKITDLWDRSVTTLAGHDEMLTAAAASGDGAILATADFDGTIIVWNSLTKEQETTFRESSAGGSLSGVSRKLEIDERGRYLMNQTNAGSLVFYHLRPTAELAVLDNDGVPIKDVAFSPRDDYVAVSDPLKVTLWSQKRWQKLRVLEGHERGILHTRLSADGRRIATTSVDGTARVWEAASGDLISILSGHELEVTSASFSSDGSLVATSSADSTARVWRSETGIELARLGGHSSRIVSLSFSPDASRLMTSTWNGDISVWDITTETPIMTLGHDENLTDTGGAFIANGGRILGCGQKPTVWSAEDGGVEFVLSKESSTCYVGPDDKMIFTTDFGQPVRAWDAESGGLEFQLQSGLVLPTNVQANKSYDFILTSGTDNKIYLWDGRDGMPLGSLEGHSGQISSARFDAAGTRIISGSLDGTARIWQITLENRAPEDIAGVVSSSSPWILADGALYKTSDY